MLKKKPSSEQQEIIDTINEAIDQMQEIVIEELKPEESKSEQIELQSVEKLEENVSPK